MGGLSLCKVAAKNHDGPIFTAFMKKISKKFEKDFCV